jgi:hypothetical protein
MTAAMHLGIALSSFRYARCRVFSSSSQSLLSLAKADVRARSRAWPTHAQQASTGQAGNSATPASTTPPAGVYGRWRTQWSSFLAQLYAAGHFAADPQVQPENLDANKGWLPAPSFLSKKQTLLDPQLSQPPAMQAL